MKLKQKELARKLRGEGLSINEIRKKVGVSKSSVSYWVRDIELTPLQKQVLSEKGVQREVIERQRSTRLKNEKEKREKVIRKAQEEVVNITRRELWLIGSMLYWAEGTKRSKAVVQFSNSDPEMIRTMMKFFREMCSVPESKFRGYIHIHPHLDHRKAERYWSGITKIPLRQFYKTYRKMNKSSSNREDRLPNGTMDIYICSTELLLKITGWVKGVFKAIDKV